MTIGPCELWRQDDNGQRFLVGRYSTRTTAEQQLATLSRAVHKQTYWIEEAPETLERLKQP